MAQQTAVEFYDQALRKCLMGTVECDPNQIFEDANQMFKEQIMDAAKVILFASTGPGDTAAEQYYNETYNK
jgi:hypothetical protein